jgi:VCBS repeat-containing protein
MFKRNSSRGLIVAIITASLVACGGGGDTGLPGTGTQPVTGASSQSSQAAAELFVLFVILIAKQIINDEDGMETATKTSNLPTAIGIGSNDSVTVKQALAEKAAVTTDFTKLCNQPKLLLGLLGLSACSGSLAIDASFAGNSAAAGAYTQFGFSNLSISTLSPAETTIINGALRLDMLAPTTLSPLTGKVKLTSTNLTSSSSLSAGTVTPQNFQFNATFANGAVTGYEDVAKSYSVSNLLLAKDSTGTTITSATMRSLLNGAQVDTVLSNVRVADKLATIKIQTPFTATVTGADNTKAEINLTATGTNDTAIGTVKITDASGIKTYNVSVPK